MFFAISGVIGMLFLRQGMVVLSNIKKAAGAKAPRMIFMMWVMLYGFVGTLMAWTLSPFEATHNDLLSFSARWVAIFMRMFS